MNKHPIYNSDPDIVAQTNATALSQEELQRRIEGIGQFLIGPGIDPGERIALHKERSAYRREIANRAVPSPLAPGRS